MTKEIMIDLYNTDEDLINKYHILAPDTSENCAERTIKDLNGSYVYLLEKNDDIIGYYAMCGIQLTGFFIKPGHRNKDTIIRFWKEIEDKFKDNFYCGLYIKNTRAIEFIRKKSIEEFPINDGIFFKIKKDELCQ